MRAVAEEDARRICEGARDAAIEQADFAEEFDLTPVESVLRLLSASEVTDQQRDAVIFGTDTGRQCRCFINGNSKAVHARIDMQRRTAVPLISRAECVPLREFDETTNHRLSADIGEGCRSSRQQ